MEILHTYHDGSKLYKMSIQSLLQVPIWKGNRIIDMNHVTAIQHAVQKNVMLLDSGYKTIQFLEYDAANCPIKRTYVIDGQHRLSVVGSYFEQYPDAPDFYVTVTQMKAASESDVIDYFNTINNDKPIQFQEDPTIIANTYVHAMMGRFNQYIQVFRSGATKRPYMSVDKVRDALRKRVDRLKDMPVDTFVARCVDVNQQLLDELLHVVLDKDAKMIQKMIQLEFALAFDTTYKWLDDVLA